MILLVITNIWLQTPAKTHGFHKYMISGLCQMSVLFHQHTIAIQLLHLAVLLNKTLLSTFINSEWLNRV